MRLISIRKWLLTAFSSGLQILIFPMAGTVPWWRAALCWVALVPFLIALLSPADEGKLLSVRQSAVLGYLCGILWYLGNCYWIYQTMYLYGGLPKPVALGILILFSLYLGLYHALFAALVAVLRRSSLSAAGLLIAVPFLWTAVELARARITGFPWDLLGYSQIDNLQLTRLAPIAGVMSLSFVIVAVNVSLASFFVMKKNRLLVPALALLAACSLQLVAKRGVDRSLQPDRLAVSVQENLQVGAPGREARPLSPQDELADFSALSLHPYTLDFFSGTYVWKDTAGAAKPAVILWPEAPSHLQSNDPAFRAAMSQLAVAAHAPLVIGSLGVDFDPTVQRGYYLYDSASLFNATGAYQSRYDKIHLVPWGEYIPFKNLFAFARKLTEGVGDMDPGHARTVFTTGGHTYGVFICYESIFGDEVRHFAANGAEVLVQISDDGWYGDTGAPWQHLNMARMRAIENHRWLLRSTNTGITTAIDPQGRMAAQAPRHVRAAFAFPFAFTQGATFYTRHGDWFAWLCVLITAIAIASALSSKPRSTA